MKQLQTIDDIKTLVDAFYARIREDELLAPVFNQIIEDRWPEHLEKMYRFWQTVLLNEHTYHGSPFAPHAKLDVNKAHFERWIDLFYQTIDEYFTGTVADEAKWRAARMAEMFHFKIEHYKSRPSSMHLR
ncbi:MAG: group III truncated hemoglobin [Flavobacteriales bacterium]